MLKTMGVTVVAMSLALTVLTASPTLAASNQSQSTVQSIVHRWVQKLNEQPVRDDTAGAVAAVRG